MASASDIPQGAQHSSDPLDAIENNSKPVLKYGSLIYLTFTEENLSEYYAYSEGLTKTKVLLKTKESFNREGSYTRGLFRIYPSFYHNEYMKAKAKFQDIMNGEGNQHEKREARTQIPKLVKGVSEELALNLEKYEKLTGTPVRYGEVIQLLHVGSQKYLAYDPESPSDLESDCLRIELKYENSDCTCFRILPSFKYQQESQGYIYNEDIVYMMSTVDSGARIFGDPYLHASRTVGVLNKDNPNKENLDKKEINVSSDKKSQWRIKIFSDNSSEKLGVLSIGDIIWINLSEEDKNLIVFNSNERENEYSFKFVLCSSSDRHKKFVGNSNGMFIVEGLNMAQGGLVKWKTAYRLKHLTTNKYLSVGPQQPWEIDERKDNRIHSFKLVSSDKEAANFFFEILYSTISSQNKQLFTKYVPKDAYFKLRVENDLWVTYKDMYKGALEVKDQYDEDYITLPLIGKTKENNIFHCSRATQNEVIVTMFLISCKNTIKNTLKYLDPEFMSYAESDFQQLQLKHKVVTYKLDRMKACLKQLELFCGNKLLEYLSVDQIFGQTNPFIQNILKEQFFIELLAYTLVICFPQHQHLKDLKRTEDALKEKKEKKNDNSLNLLPPDPSLLSPGGKMLLKKMTSAIPGADDNDVVQAFTAEIIEDINHKKKKICELSYKLIMAVVDKNVPNKNYAFQYLAVFQMQAEYMSCAVDCVNMILRDNEELLLNLHKNNVIFQGNQAPGASGPQHQLSIFNAKGENSSFRVKQSYLTKAGARDSFRSGMQSGKSSNNLDRSQQAMKEDLYEMAYENYYNKMAKNFQGSLTKVLKDWDPIKFFAVLLQKTEDIQKQKKLLHFFKTISLQGQEGININQEIIYKYFTQIDTSGHTIIDLSLLRLFTKEGSRLFVKVPFAPYKGKEYELKDFLETNDGAADYNPLLNYSEESSGVEGDMDYFGSMERRNEEILINHIDLCAALCRSRNHSWKFSLEKEISWESLMSHLVEELPEDIKAALNRLMTSLFIDQEPRREMAIPLFCKIFDKRKLNAMENNKGAQGNNALMTITTMKTKDFKESPAEINITKFKSQLLKEIEQLDKIVEELPHELNKENIMVFEKKLSENWVKAYNSYVLELLQTIHLMLKFNKIKIEAKKITMKPLSKSTETNEKGRRKGKSKSGVNFGIGISLGLNIGLNNLFSRAKPKDELTEFENVMRSIMLLLEYDKTYPEARKTLKDVRKEKEEKKNQEKSVLSAKKLFNTVQGLGSLAKGLLIDTKAGEKKTNKKTIDLDFLDKEMTTNELYLKQGDVMKRILQNLLSQQELDIESTIKIKVLDILEYFFEFKQDKLLSNVRRVFFNMVRESDLIQCYRDQPETIKEKVQEVLPHYVRYILPQILLTGTATDEQDDVFKTDSEDILDINEMLGFELLPVLFQQLCLNSHSLFERKILHLMMRMYNQREEFTESVQNVLLLFEESNIQYYNRAKKVFQTLQKYSEESEKWLTSPKLDESALQITRNTLLFFYNSLFSMVPIMEDEDPKFEPHQIDHQPINKVRQDMYRHLKIHIPVLSLIKDNIHIVERNKSEKILELFRICFAFLTAFAKDNETNQLLLANSMVVFLYNLSADLGHVKLLVELFRNNFLLCTTRVEEVIDDICRLISTNGRRADYLEFFKVIQCVNGKMQFTNQRMVLDIFLDPQTKYSLLYFEKDGREEEKINEKGIKEEKGSGFTHTFSFEAENSGNKVDEPFLYHAQLFHLLGMTADGKEGLILNEVRLRGILDCEYLLELLVKEDNFTSDNPDDNLLNHLSAKEFEIIKIPLTEYIFHVYLESEKTAIEVSKNQAVMKKLLEKEQKRIATMKHHKDKYVTYLFDKILPIFCWHYKQVRQGQIDGEVENPLVKRDFNELSQFTDVLTSNIGKFDISKISLSGRDNLLDLLFFLEKNQKRAELETLLNGPKGASGEVTLVYGDLKRDIPEEEVWKLIWRDFLDVFLNSKTLEEEIDKEKKTFAKALTQIDKLFKKEAHIKDIINNEEVVKKFINFVIGSGNAEETRSTVILILEALGNLINNEKEEEQMIEKQNFLNRNNAVYMVFSRLSDPHLLSSDRIFKELITFAIHCLDGGNEEVQKNVFKHFTSFNNSEVFFLKLHERFDLEILHLKKLREDPSYKIPEEENDEMKDILRLLQLFAEGHYSDLQNYIRYQTNSYHSYDLLADISDLLNAYMQTKHAMFFDTMIQCFDTITEFIQGPCLDNQVAIIQGSFLDLSSNLLSVDERFQEEMKVKLGESDLKKWQWARLKHKCSVTLLSLLEARNDENNVYRMMKSLPREVLRKNITDIYLLFQKQHKGVYNNDVFLHFNDDPSDEEGGKTEEYCSFIIETGFNLYFLLNIFSEAKLPGENEEDAEIFNEEEEEKNLLQDNILTKWFSVIISLFKTSVKTAQNITNKTMEHTKKMTEMLKLKEAKTTDDKSESDERAVVQQLIDERTKGWVDASKFFRKNTANIEILREDNNLEKTYFYKLPFCHAITKDTKNSFNSEANRISAKAKCAYLLKTSPELIETIKHEYRLMNIFNRIAIISVLTENIMLWRDTAFILALVINGLILGTYERNEEDPDGYSSEHHEVVTVLGCILLVLSSFIVAYFLIKTAPLLIRKAWKGTEKISQLTLSGIAINMIKTVFYLLSDSYVIYYCFYGFSAIIGLTISPFFFSLHLLDVLVRFPLLQNVLKAIWIPGKSLLLTFLLFQMLNYFFTLIGYYFFAEAYDGACPSTWICFVTSVDKAFKVDGGIGGFLVENADMKFPRFIFDNLYNLFVMIIMINIVAGIIIDNFGSLREEGKSFTYDIENICFICGNDRETLEKASEAKGVAGGKGFISHIRKDHYLWNYIFYIAYVLNKEKTEYTGLESYIADQIENGEISWFPTHRAIILKGFGNAEDSNGVVDSLKKIEEEQRSLMKDATTLSKNIFNLEDLVKKYELRKINGFSKQGTFKSVTSSINIVGDQNGNVSRHGSDSKKRVSSRYEDGMGEGGETFDLNNEDNNNMQ